MTGHALPADWAPSEADTLYGLGLGHTTAAIADMAEDMRLWAGANANRQVARKLRWDLAFRSWMRREAAKRGKPHGTGSANPTMAAFDRIIDSAAGAGEPDGTGFKDITPTGSGVRQDAGRTVAARQPAESWGLFAVDRKDP
jgi:hypothetical protein